MRGRKSADMALGNGSANRQQRWGNGKGTNCTAEHVLSHSSGYYYIIVLYISLSCTYHCLVCSPHSAKRMQVVTTHVHVSQTRQLTVRHSRLCCPHGDVCVRKTVRLECQVLRESKREMWLVSSRVMPCHRDSRDLSMEDRRLLEGRQCNVRAPYMWVGQGGQRTATTRLVLVVTGWVGESWCMHAKRDPKLEPKPQQDKQQDKQQHTQQDKQEQKPQ
jgi:hypothetical protein